MSQGYSTSMTTLSVLERAAQQSRAFRASDIRESLGMPRGQLFAHLVTLREAGWLEQLPDSSFRLTLKAHFVGEKALVQSGIGERIRPAMEALASQVREAVSLAIADGDTARIVQRIDPDRAVLADSTYETRMSLGQSASGRVLLAWGEGGKANALRQSGLQLPTDDELAAIRAKGFALSEPGAGIETIAVAVPIFDAAGAVLAALSVIGPLGRFEPRQALKEIERTAERISDIQRGAGRTEPSDR